VSSLLVAIGLEAFNKFSLEQKEQMEEEEERETIQVLEEEQERRAKITGRLLLKGVRDMVLDSLASAKEDLVSLLCEIIRRKLMEL
jgi:hypothetical protein